MNSGECSEIVFNNGYYVVTIMDTSSMMDNALQVTILPSTNMEKQSFYYYFSATFEVSIYQVIAKLSYIVHGLSYTYIATYKRKF